MSTGCSVREWPVVAVHSRSMVTGKDLRKGRQLKRMTLAQAADAMRVGARTVGRWESQEELPESAVPAVEKFLGLGDEEADALEGMGDAELVAHIMSAVAVLASRLPDTRTLPPIGRVWTDNRPNLRKPLGPHNPNTGDGENGYRKDG